MPPAEPPVLWREWLRIYSGIGLTAFMMLVGCSGVRGEGVLAGAAAKRAFSARSALKKMSKGDASRTGASLT